MYGWSGNMSIKNAFWTRRTGCTACLIPCCGWIYSVSYSWYDALQIANVCYALGARRWRQSPRLSAQLYSAFQRRCALAVRSSRLPRCGATSHSSAVVPAATTDSRVEMNSVSSRAGAGGGFRSGCVRTLGGGRGVGSDGEAEGSSREERRCCTEGGEEHGRREEETQMPKEKENVRRGKWNELFRHSLDMFLVFFNALLG